MKRAFVDGVATPPAPRAPSDPGLTEPRAGTRPRRGGGYEIPISHRARTQRGHRRRWRLAAIGSLVALGVASSATATAWLVRPDVDGAAAPAQIRPAVPPPGGFAVPADDMAARLVTLLGAELRSDVARELTTSYVEPESLGQLPRVVQVGSILMADGSRLRVEVRRAPDTAWCPVESCVEAAGATSVRVVTRGQVEVVVEQEAARAPLDQTELTEIATASVWTG